MSIQELGEFSVIVGWPSREAGSGGKNRPISRPDGARYTEKLKEAIDGLGSVPEVEVAKLGEFERSTIEGQERTFSRKGI